MDPGWRPVGDWRGEEHPDLGGELPFLADGDDWPNPEGPEWRMWKDLLDEED